MHHRESGFSFSNIVRIKQGKSNLNAELQALVDSRRKDLEEITELALAVEDLVRSKKLVPRHSTITSILVELGEGGQEESINTLHRLIHERRIRPELTVLQFCFAMKSILTGLVPEANPPK